MMLNDEDLEYSKKWQVRKKHFKDMISLMILISVA